MKKNLTSVQHWKMMAANTLLENMKLTSMLAQEREEHLHTQLKGAQEANIAAKQQYRMMGQTFKAEFVNLGRELGADGDSDKWKIHIADEPSESTVAWEESK